MPTVLAFLPQSNRPYSNLIIHLEAVIEVSTSEALRLSTTSAQGEVFDTNEWDLRSNRIS